MLRMSSMDVNSKGNAVVYCFCREAKAAFPIPTVSCFEHHFQWMCQFGEWCEPRSTDFKASSHHCKYFISVFCMQDQNDESWLVLLWSRKDLVLGQNSLTTLPNVFFMLCFPLLTYSLTHSLTHLLTWRAWIHYYQSLHVPCSTQLVVLRTRTVVLEQGTGKGYLGVGGQDRSPASGKLLNQNPKAKA